MLESMKLNIGAKASGFANDKATKEEISYLLEQERGVPKRQQKEQRGPSWRASCPVF
jgi:hypothetical protein